MLKLNLCCGTSRLPGWENHEAEVDLNKPLQWGNETASFILLEHVLQRWDSAQAYRLLKECQRVLAPGGVIRICVPEVTRAERAATTAYAAFMAQKGWGDSPVSVLATRPGDHVLWHFDTLAAVLRSFGLQAHRARPQQSRHPELCNIDSYHHVIGAEFNELETMIVEGTKPPRSAISDSGAVPSSSGQTSSTGKRTLVFGTMYVRNAEQTALTRLWLSLVRNIHESDWLLVDSDSPAAFVTPIDAPRRHVKEGIQANTIVNLGDNIGHLGKTGRDGWGRAFVTGLQFAIDAGYDRVVHMEGDLLSKVAFEDVFSLMASTGKRAACPFCPYVHAAETGMMYFDVPYIKAADFIKRYDWRTSPPLPGPQPERRIMEILGPDLMWLPWEMNGCRNEHFWIEAQADAADMELGNFIRSLYYLTHAPLAYLQAYLDDAANGPLRLDVNEQLRKVAARTLRPLVSR